MVLVNIFSDTHYLQMYVHLLGSHSELLKDLDGTYFLFMCLQELRS
jgi:hypothetical protein